MGWPYACRGVGAHVIAGVWAGHMHAGVWAGHTHTGARLVMHAGSWGLVICMQGRRLATSSMGASHMHAGVWACSGGGIDDRGRWSTITMVTTVIKP